MSSKLTVAERLRTLGLFLKDGEKQEDLSDFELEVMDLCMEAANELTQLIQERNAFRKALKALHYDCTAHDFNEHWDSYKAAEALFPASTGDSNEAS